MDHASAASTDTPLAVTPYGGAGANYGYLARAPYVTDLTSSSAQVNWATSASLTTLGSVQVAQESGGTCPSSVTTWSANALPATNALPVAVKAGSWLQSSSVLGSAFTIQGSSSTDSDNQSSVLVDGLSPTNQTGLQPATTYCYAVFSSDVTGAANLLPTSEPFQSFTTLANPNASSTKPVTFDVVGDTGENFSYTSSKEQLPFLGNSNPNAPVNPDQASVFSQIGASTKQATNPAQFLLVAGDVGYSDGSQQNYGDLQQTETVPAEGTANPEVSNIFGPSYFPETGGIPTYVADGNHGQNPTTLMDWPTTATAESSGGTYDEDFPNNSASDGVSPTITSPDDWYAFSSGNVRVYVLDAAWGDSNIGSATGSLCPTPSDCLGYQADASEHWQTTSPEYQWLQKDLSNSAYSGMVKMAVFHFPLRSVNATQPSDPYLENDSSVNPAAATSLEALLAEHGVALAFNGHAHTYQRIIPNHAYASNQLINYVTGGGGGWSEPVTGGSCSTMITTASVYALGWSPAQTAAAQSSSPGKGSSCGQNVPAASTVSAADVYNYLQVTVQGSSVTVTPYNAAGQPFDQQTYAPPTITSASSAAFAPGTLGSFTVTTASNPSPALSASGVPSWATFVDNGNGTATLSGTPPTGTTGTFPVTITAANGFGTPVTQAFSLSTGTAAYATPQLVQSVQENESGTATSLEAPDNDQIREPSGGLGERVHRGDESNHRLRLRRQCMDAGPGLVELRRGQRLRWRDVVLGQRQARHLDQSDDQIGRVDCHGGRGVLGGGNDECPRCLGRYGGKGIGCQLGHGHVYHCQ